MNYYDYFLLQVEKEYRLVANSKFLSMLLNGTAPTEAYALFLRETYHLSRHTPRFLAAAAANMPDEKDAIRTRFLHHAIEEDGHHKFALKDLRNLGYPDTFALDSYPLAGTCAIVSYHYYLAFIDNPIGMLGAVVVFEGLAEAFAGTISDMLQQKQNLPLGAVSFLHTHGKFDIDHMKEARQVLNELVTEEKDKQDIIEVAKKMYRYYSMNFDEIYERTILKEMASV
jgi:thiaminase